MQALSGKTFAPKDTIQIVMPGTLEGGITEWTQTSMTLLKEYKANLWRSQGCPEPTTTVNPFVDVPSTEYYYKPVLWAVENNITKGTSDTTFDPEDTLTTAHIITFLYRTKNPGMDGWNGEAAAWAADSNVKPFGVDIAVDNVTNCPRCNVVQFLYKLSK